MTLYVIPDLVWREFNFHSRSITKLGWFRCEHYVNQFVSGWRVWLDGKSVIAIGDDRLKAQSAANEWYKAKMAEGLKVATVEELRQAIKEMESL